MFTHEYAQAERAARRCLALDAQQTLVKTNLAHALLFQNKDAAAQAEYNALKTQKDAEGKSYRALLKEDFDALEKAGLDKKQLDKAQKWIAE